MPDASMGFQSRLSMAAAGTAIGSFTESYEFVSEEVRKRLTILETAGLRGTRSHPAERARDGTYVVAGTIRFHVTPLMLDLLLPRILGAPEASDLFTLAETLPEFDLLIDRVAKRFVYGGCKVRRALFQGRAGGLIELQLEVWGKTEVVSGTAFPAIAAPLDPPYVFQDGTLTLSGVSRKMMEFALTIDNRLSARFTNSQAATDLSPTDRLVTFECRTPYTSDEIDLYGQNVGGAGAATLALVNGGYSTTFTIPKLQVPDTSPIVQGKQEIQLHLTGQARKSGSTNELAITHDSTP
ncbi:MAG: phage tail tube protein [Planctomycetales bacterium]